MHKTAETCGYYCRKQIINFSVRKEMKAECIHFIVPDCTRPSQIWPSFVKECALRLCSTPDHSAPHSTSHRLLSLTLLYRNHSIRRIIRIAQLPNLQTDCLVHSISTTHSISLLNNTIIITTFTSYSKSLQFDSLAYPGSVKKHLATVLGHTAA
jgi:hypothetical protein